MAAEGEAVNMQDPKEAVSSDSIAPKKIMLRTLEGKLFEVDELLVKQSGTIVNAICDGCADDLVLPLPNVTAPILAKIIEYWKMHAGPEDEEAGKKFGEEFIRPFDKDGLFQIINAANYLDCRSLLDLACQTVASIIKNMSVLEVREYFDIEKDLTPEEEEEIMEETGWTHAR